MKYISAKGNFSISSICSGPHYTWHMESTVDPAPAERLRRARLAAGYRTASEFAAKHDIPQPTYQQHETAGRGIKPKVAQDYARKLKNVDAAWILTGHGKGPAESSKIVGDSGPAPGIQSQSAPGNEAVLNSPPRAVRVVSRVQAGAWRETPELPGDERYDVFVPVEPIYANLQVVGAEVVGASMDLLYPAGTLLIVVNAIDLGDGWMPEPGDRVLARRLSREGLYETTVKEFAVDAQGRAWLVPRSSDPSLMPVPAETPLDADDEPVRVVGLVIGSYRPEKPRSLRSR